MCLTCASRLKKARKDIKCYKVAFEIDPNVFESPYLGSKEVNFWKGDGMNVIECIIPKGTKYFRGRFQNKLKCFASEKLIFTRNIFRNNEIRFGSFLLCKVSRNLVKEKPTHYEKK